MLAREPLHAHVHACNSGSWLEQIKTAKIETLNSIATKKYSNW
jgi:hypothetical protein